MDRLKLIAAMIIFGSASLFTSFLPFSAAMLTGIRALIGAIVLSIVLVFRRKTINKNGMRRNMLSMILSGAACGLHGVFLGEAMRFASFTTVILLYFTAPLILLLLSPLFAKERLTIARLLCAAVAMIGAVFTVTEELAISGMVFYDGAFKGVLFACGAALMLAFVVLLTKPIRSLKTTEIAFCQLSAATVTAFVIALVWRGETTVILTGETVLALVIIGVIHTAVACVLFWDAARKLPAQSTALMVYIAPLAAMFLTTVVVNSGKISAFQTAGFVLVTAAIVVAEVLPKPRKKAIKTKKRG